ncbi:dTDP-4-dehydrorhamnose 3,5-epimerase [Marinobacter sp. S6332]|uniref:dTDP-4-dehydrorhamnose 3,5-epimerase n=1 Tax=Marinobacter sp. S6332 TaxID=2926403 RepID=UPI001FF1DAEA|nr:dTDP-4-dehydrorhamnose 3,5-epimerase [Marinobacter sp. S6332]MCK0163751.1 dTDP-4-dehydrorhamnose 3,5-epimerase [Marinobacter sp. S6332]
MEIKDTALPDVKLVLPKVFGDSRGFFKEVWNQRELARHGLHVEFVQDNFSRSCRNTLRGLHFQEAKPQGKLVWVSRGEVCDVAVDVRRESPTFGKWIAERLSCENHRMLWIPPGFAHGFRVLSNEADFQYKCTEFYDPDDERCIRWDDETLAIDWGDVDSAELIISEKDASAPSLKAMFEV